MKVSMQVRLLFTLVLLVLATALAPKPAYALTARYVTWRVWFDENRNGAKDANEDWLNQNWAKIRSTFDSTSGGGGVVVVEKWLVSGGYIYNGAQNSPAFITIRVIVPSSGVCFYPGGVQSTQVTIGILEGSGSLEFHLPANYCV